MPCLMSTEEYARSYDRCAERLYRFALYVLGMRARPNRLSPMLLQADYRPVLR